MYGSGGGEAIDIALKSARHATKKRGIVSVAKAYHGHTGLAVATGDERFATLFLSDRPDEFAHVPFNDLDAMEAALRGRDVAAVIMETIPATYGFPLPAPGYLAGVKRLCERYGALYIADEVQTGLMRTGELWAISKHGVNPDILVSGKGISGGMYPVSVVLATEAAAGWLTEDGFAHMSTFGGAELGCVAALKTLEITCRPEVRSMVHYIAGMFTGGLAQIQAQYPDWFTGIRQDGLVMGLEFGHPQGAKFVMKRLYENGVWAIFSTLDPRVLQYKPGILLTPALCEELLERTEVAIGKARDDATSTRGGAGGDRGADHVAELLTDPAGVPRARAMLQRAEWAARAFARYDKPGVDAIVRAAAAAGAAKAREYADWAVRETGFGVAEHKVLKNIACSTGIVDHYAGHDYVTPRIDAEAKIVEVPRPAGVVLALTPSTNPVATVFFKCLLALMTRSVVVLSPHPLAKEVCADAARTLGRRGRRGGCPQRRHPGGGRAVGAADRRADDRRAHQRHRRDRRRSRGARRLQLGHARHRRRAGQRAGAGGRDRRPGQGGPADRGQQELRQLGPVHQRVGADRRRAGGDRAAAAAEAGRRLPARAGRAGPRIRDAVPRRAVRHPLRRQGRELDRGRGGPAGTEPHPYPARAVRPGDAGGTAGPREALPGARPGPGAVRPARDRRRAGRAAAVRPRPLGGHPQHRPARDHGVRGRGRGPAGRRQRGQQPGQRGPPDQPGPHDDDRHRVLRPVLGGGEPAPQPPGAVDAAGLQPRPGRAVRRLRGAGALAGAGRPGTPVPGGVQPAGRPPAARRRRRTGRRPGPFGT